MSRRVAVFVVLMATVAACGDEPEEISTESQQETVQQEDEDNQQSDEHSDPPSEPDCMETLDQPTACGGVVEGTWENGDICTDFQLQQVLSQVGCFGADVETFDYWVADGSGTVEFSDDEMTRDLEVVIDLDMYIPQDCLEFGSTELDCASFASTADDYIGLNMQCDPPEQSESEDEPGCDCVADEEHIDRSFSGSYDIDENNAVLTLQPDGIQYYYCAEDGVLNMRNLDDYDIPVTEAFTYAPH